MAYQDKTPPIRLDLDKSFFNLMLEILNKNEGVTTNSINDRAKRLKDKLLRYTRPYDLEDGNNAARVAFFNREASEMIDQLLVFVALNSDMEIELDYYSVLLKIREEKNSQAKEE